MEQTGWGEVADLHLRRRDKARPCLLDLRRLHVDAPIKGYTKILRAEVLRHALLMGEGVT